MRIGPAPLLPLNPLQPDRSVPYPKALGAAFVGKPYLSFPEVKIRAPEAPQAPIKDVGPSRVEESRETSFAKPLEPVKTRGALAQLPEPRSTSDPAGPLGSRIDLLA